MMSYIQPHWPAASHIKAYTTTRQSWTRFPTDTRDEAYRTLQSALQLPSSPIWLDQKHSTTVIEALPHHTGRLADASFTHQTNHICLVETADCLPLLICNQLGTSVAAIHAGWRGLANGIIENTLAALHQPAENLLVWLGPAIGPQKFEVGKDVYDAFMSHDAKAKEAFTPVLSEKWLANLYLLAKQRLQAAGIAQIYSHDFCTYTQSELFFSYRRDKGITGRMASFIWIADK